MSTRLEGVRAKVIEAVPEIDAGEQVSSRGADITLADVLRAIDSVFEEKPSLELCGWGVAINGMFFKEGKGYMKWNLALSLDEQDEEVIGFLHTILCQ